MALIAYTDLNGGAAAFNSDAFVRMRPTHGDSEPRDALTIRVDTKRLHASDAPDELAAALRASVTLVSLRTPNDLPVWINAARLDSVTAALSSIHHPSAQSVVTLAIRGGPAIEQQVRETVAEVQAAFNAN
ncbi:MAG: hypothetical protein AAGA05_00575 [Pseudomonadota bacterium]